MAAHNLVAVAACHTLALVVLHDLAVAHTP